MKKDDLVSVILEIEWVMFQNVKNIGGTAACQTNRNAFEIMRYSQAMSWSEATLESYLDDLRAAQKSGRNLMTEKYARMMESTSPLEYDRIKHLIPPVNPEVMPQIERIVQIELKWQAELLEKYPHLVSKGRPIYSSADNPSVTSFETYLKGELSTYSPKTLNLYSNDIASYVSEGKNAAMLVLEHTVKRYGYDSLEEAENRLKAQ